jgi:hypothetical protein
MYKENPKTKGSGIMCAIPQKGRCPNECDDCFFQSGRSYLEPLDENTPNIPDLPEELNMFHLESLEHKFNSLLDGVFVCLSKEENEIADEILKQIHDIKKGIQGIGKHVIRINDGNDSNVNRVEVIAYSTRLKEIGVKYFFNTSIPDDLEGFPGPVVLTVNPGEMTDTGFYSLKDIPENLMFVRFRANMWNRISLDKCVAHYTSRGIPVVVTFMAYFATWSDQKIPKQHVKSYTFRKRTLNSYMAITTKAAEYVMEPFRYNKLVYQCGKIEGERGDTHCRYCGNCIREYFATMERMNHE